MHHREEEAYPERGRKTIKFYVYVLMSEYCCCSGYQYTQIQDSTFVYNFYTQYYIFYEINIYSLYSTDCCWTRPRQCAALVLQKGMSLISQQQPILELRVPELFFQLNYIQIKFIRDCDYFWCLTLFQTILIECYHAGMRCPHVANSSLIVTLLNVKCNLFKFYTIDSILRKYLLLSLNSITKLKLALQISKWNAKR